LFFLQILPVQAQRSSGSRGVNFANWWHGKNVMWDFDDGVLRIWSTNQYGTNPDFPWTPFADWSDCILPYKAYMKDPARPDADNWNFYPEGDDHWKGLEGISPAHPPFTETPWYPIREHVRQIQIDGSIYYIGSFSLCYFPNCRSVILHEGVEELATGAVTRLHSLKHVYFPSSLDYINALNFIHSPPGYSVGTCL
jgi:hypothetical protein